MEVLSDSKAVSRHGEEDDYEDMMTPTDDEGITSLNHTQKIPISLIKAKDKASVSSNLNLSVFVDPFESLPMDDRLSSFRNCSKPFLSRPKAARPSKTKTQAMATRITTLLATGARIRRRPI